MSLGNVIVFIALAAPVACGALLLGHAAARTRPSPVLAFGIFFGSLAWMLFFVPMAALDESWRPWIFVPIPVGVLFGTVASRFGNPEKGVLSALGDGFVFLVLSMMLWIGVGGGYFDKLFWISHATELLAREGISERDTEALARALSHPDRFARYGALRALKRLGRDAEPAAEPLLAALHDSDPLVRHEAEGVLYGWKSFPEASVPALAAHLGHPDHHLLVRDLLKASGPAGAAALQRAGAVSETR